MAAALARPISFVFVNLWWKGSNLRSACLQTREWTYKWNKNFLQGNFLRPFILQIIFRTILVFKKQEKLTPPSVFKKSYHYFFFITGVKTNTTEQTWMYANNVLEKKSTKRKRFFSCWTSGVFQNYNFLQPKYNLRYV